VRLCGCWRILWVEAACTFQADAFVLQIFGPMPDPAKKGEWNGREDAEQVETQPHPWKLLK